MSGKNLNDFPPLLQQRENEKMNEDLIQADIPLPDSSEKFIRADERRVHGKCPCCNYSAPPHEHRAEYKHFDPHWLECDRCHWQTQTYPNFTHARWAWNYASAIELAVQKAEMNEFFPSRSGLGAPMNISNEPERTDVSLNQPTLPGSSS